ncbi:uncharacterized protein MONBRDRAFT_35549 [Monosiga brevicollis MX1]|uniref:Inner centromere protein ARK-binding domain-containing protein n=1 Tax=Monosiga brevicollis TaxID=81824 RepID=A9UPV2_MONBE|nr:uncharacterized protein MONBRDRAFT_35549 [Monosiga brevicollis MX1]EDQ92485.1 predicted protein [Monosiga brevicollis MX1]|eukprot:XP_001742247.1 hypothetical protein [Monosiga brevicollis MX1]
MMELSDVLRQLVERADGCASIVVSDRDGVSIVQASSDKIRLPSGTPSYFAVAAQAAEHLSKMGHGGVSTIAVRYDKCQVVHFALGAIVVSAIALPDANTVTGRCQPCITVSHNSSTEIDNSGNRGRVQLREPATMAALSARSQKNVATLLDAYETVATEQLQVFEDNIAQHFTWLDELVPSVRDAWTSDLKDGSSQKVVLLPKTPSHNKRVPRRHLADKNADASPAEVKGKKAGDNSKKQAEPAPRAASMSPVREEASMPALESIAEDVEGDGSDTAPALDHSEADSMMDQSPEATDGETVDDAVEAPVPDEAASQAKSPSNGAASPSDSKSPASPAPTSALDTTYVSPAPNQPLETPSTVVKNGQFTPRMRPDRPNTTHALATPSRRVREMVARLQSSASKRNSAKRASMVCTRISTSPDPPVTFVSSHDAWLESYMNVLGLQKRDLATKASFDNNDDADVALPTPAKAVMSAMDEEADTNPELPRPARSASSTSTDTTTADDGAKKAKRGGNIARSATTFLRKPSAEVPAAKPKPEVKALQHARMQREKELEKERERERRRQAQTERHEQARQRREQLRREEEQRRRQQEAERARQAEEARLAKEAELKTQREAKERELAERRRQEAALAEARRLQEEKDAAAAAAALAAAEAAVAAEREAQEQEAALEREREQAAAERAAQIRREREQKRREQEEQKRREQEEQERREQEDQERREQEEQERREQEEQERREQEEQKRREQEEQKRRMQKEEQRREREAQRRREQQELQRREEQEEAKRREQARALARAKATAANAAQNSQNASLLDYSTGSASARDGYTRISDGEPAELPRPAKHATPNTSLSSASGSARPRATAAVEGRPSDNYDISGLRSDDSTDDDDSPKRPIPTWAKKPALTAALYKQHLSKRSPSAIFPAIEDPDLSKIFPNTQKPRYRSRTSSARWEASPRHPGSLRKLY